MFLLLAPVPVLLYLFTGKSMRVPQEDFRSGKCPLGVVPIHRGQCQSRMCPVGDVSSREVPEYRENSTAQKHKAIKPTDTKAIIDRRLINEP